MSRIPDIGKNLDQLPNVLAEYETALDGVEDILTIKGKTIERANQENPSWQHYYDQKRVELSTIVKYLEGQVARVRGKLFKSYTETYQRELSDRAKDKYVDNEEAYLNMYEVYLEAKEIYDKYQAVCDAFQARGYALNNITRARVADVHDMLLS